MFWCCADETKEATIEAVPELTMLEVLSKKQAQAAPAVAVWEVPAARRAEVEPAAVVEQAVAFDGLAAEEAWAPTSVPLPPPPEAEEPQAPQEFQAVVEEEPQAPQEFQAVVEEEPQAPQEFQAVVEEEPQAPQEFQAVLVREAVKLPYGWALDMLNPNALYIETLAGSPNTPVAAYNTSAPAGEHIREGDYITRVNGASGSTRELGEWLCGCLRAQVTIQRPSNYVVELSMGDKPLGLNLNHTPKGKNLCIVKVIGGVVQEQAPEVSQGYRILSVNGNNSTASDMIEALKGSSLKLDILRAPVV